MDETVANLKIELAERQEKIDQVTRQLTEALEKNRKYESKEALREAAPTTLIPLPMQVKNEEL